MVLEESKVVTKADGTPIAGGGRRLEKVGFAVIPQTQEERDNNADKHYVGDLQQWVEADQQPSDSVTSDGEIDTDDIPF